MVVIKIEPILEEVIGRGMRVAGWTVSTNNEKSDYGFRSEAIDAAALIAKHADGPSTIEIVR